MVLEYYEYPPKDPSFRHEGHSIPSSHDFNDFYSLKIPPLLHPLKTFVPLFKEYVTKTFGIPLSLYSFVLSCSLKAAVFLQKLELYHLRLAVNRTTLGGSTTD